MPADQLVQNLESALSKVPLIDPHSHIDPLAPVSKSLDDILGYHYYTELAHSAGMSQTLLAKDADPRDAVRAKSCGSWTATTTLRNTAGSWTIARTFLGFDGQESRDHRQRRRPLFDAALKTFAQPRLGTTSLRRRRSSKRSS